MKKKLKRSILIFLLLAAVVYYFDINIHELYTSAQTFVIDKVDSFFPGAKGQFENIDSQINSAIIKNSTTRTINLKFQKAKKNAQSLIKHKWLKFKKFSLKHNVDLDSIHYKFKQKFKYRKRNVTNGTLYSFDYQNMNAQELSSIRQNFINYSLTLRGTPYILGGENPEKGLDCSSFVQQSARKGAKIRLPRTARQQYEVAEKISFSEIEPGDLVFFRAYGKIDHVGIYLGLYEGEGILKGRKIFINSASKGPRTGVVISALDEPYWKKHFNSCGRIIPSSKEIAEAEIVVAAE